MRTASFVGPVVAAPSLAESLLSAPSCSLELKVADAFPSGRYRVRLSLKSWMDDVTRRTSGAIGKGYVAPSSAPDKIPLSEVPQSAGSRRSAELRA